MLGPYFIIILILIAILIIMGVSIGLHLDKSNYFQDVIHTNSPLHSKLKFFIKKHTIFRFFALFYAVIHYVLNVISVATSFITVYMVMIEGDTLLNMRIFFLLTSAISTNLLIGFRLDKISGAYAQAMRILEEAILKCCDGGKDDKLPENGQSEDKQPENNLYKMLYEANSKAEQYLGDKFF